MIAWLLRRWLDRLLNKAVAKGWLMPEEEARAAAAIMTLGETLWAAYRRRAQQEQAGLPRTVSVTVSAPAPKPIPPSPPGTTAADLNRAELERLRQQREQH